jgi:hypothetical protein
VSCFSLVVSGHPASIDLKHQTLPVRCDVHRNEGGPAIPADSTGRAASPLMDHSSKDLAAIRIKQVIDVEPLSAYPNRSVRPCSHPLHKAILPKGGGVGALNRGQSAALDEKRRFAWKATPPDRAVSAAQALNWR